MAFTIPKQRHEEIGERIGLIADDYGGQGRLAAAIGTSDSNLSQVVNGQVGAGNKILIPLADLGYNTQWVITGIGSMHMDSSAAVTGKRRLTNREILLMVEERMMPDETGA